MQKYAGKATMDLPFRQKGRLTERASVNIFWRNGDTGRFVPVTLQYIP